RARGGGLRLLGGARGDAARGPRPVDRPLSAAGGEEPAGLPPPGGGGAGALRGALLAARRPAVLAPRQRAALRAPLPQRLGLPAGPCPLGREPRLGERPAGDPPALRLACRLGEGPRAPGLPLPALPGEPLLQRRAQPRPSPRAAPGRGARRGRM